MTTLLPAPVRGVLRWTADVVSLAFDLFVPVAKSTRYAVKSWPDGEQPLIDGPESSSADGAVDYVAASGPAADERPAGARDFGLTVPAGHPNRCYLIAAAIGLREYAQLPACEAPRYWRHIADQLDPIK